MSIESACRKLVAEFQSRPTVRAGSLITTVFGDAIASRGGSIWLGSLRCARSGFGISERLVRTSVFRLAQDGWLQSVQVGRRSYYGLTAEGRERFEQATHRIYGEPVSKWDGQWGLLLLSGLDTESKDQMRKELGWLGFGALSANVLAHPAPDTVDLDVTLRRLGLTDQIVVMTGQTIKSETAIRSLAHASGNLDARQLAAVGKGVGTDGRQASRQFDPLKRGAVVERCEVVKGSLEVCLPDIERIGRGSGECLLV